MLVMTSNQVPAKTLKELVDYLKANPDKVSGGTAGIGSGSHLGALAFFKATGANYQLVPYRGTGPAMQDLSPTRSRSWSTSRPTRCRRSAPARSGPMP